MVAEYKTEFSTYILGNYMLDVFLHPIENITEMYLVRNPLLFISIGASIILYIYLIYKTRHKDYENVGDKYGVQGSSRWAKKSEIFEVPNELTIIPSKKMLYELKKTLKNNEVKK